MGMRVKPREFQNLNLRCHTLLSDTVLHDVWAIPLDGGGDGRSVGDAREILSGSRRPPANMAVRGLFKLCTALGRVFGWDDARHDPPAVSYIHRLADVFARVPGLSRHARGPVSSAVRLCRRSADRASQRDRPCLHGARAHPASGGLHALPGDLREAGKPLHLDLPRHDRSVSPLYRLPRPRPPGTASLVARECGGAPIHDRNVEKLLPWAAGPARHSTFNSRGRRSKDRRPFPVR